MEGTIVRVIFAIPLLFIGLFLFNVTAGSGVTATVILRLLGVGLVFLGLIILFYKKVYKKTNY